MVAGSAINRLLKDIIKEGDNSLGKSAILKIDWVVWRKRPHSLREKMGGLKREVPKWQTLKYK